MTNEEIAIALLSEFREKHTFYGKDHERDMNDTFDLAIKALGLLVRLEGFKYVTTDVMLKEHELAHFDIYKKGWNDAIQAAIDASDMPVTDIIKAIKENEVKQNEDY